MSLDKQQSDLPHPYFARFVSRPFTCETHGEVTEASNDSGKTYRGCSLCESEAHHKAEKDKIDAELAIANLRSLNERTAACRIPLRFADKDFSNFSPDSESSKRNLASCKDYADRFAENLKSGRCLILSGSVGTGKTHLAVSIAKQVLQLPMAGVRYTTVSGLLSEIKATYSQGFDSNEQYVMDAVIYPDLLILDEVGTTKQSEFEMATLFNLINARYERMVPTIVVSNLSLANISDALGERCYDRLREGGGIGLIFMGESNRKKK